MKYIEYLEFLCRVSELAILTVDYVPLTAPVAIKGAIQVEQEVMRTDPVGLWSR